jgi:5'-nucleotidase
MLALILTFVLTAAPGPRCFELAGVSDLHGQVEKLPDLGGYLALLRQKGPTVVVDAGDAFQGTLESNRVKGQAVVAAYNQLGFDLAVVGNHEFDYGLDELKKRIGEANYPYITANIHERVNGARAAWTNLAPRRLVRLPNGLAVGLLGLITEDTPNVTLPENVTTLEFRSAVEAAKEQAAALRKEGANVIVGVGHIGGRCKKVDNPDDLSSCEPGSELFRMLKALPAGTLHAFVGGHTHQRVAHRVNGVPAVQAGANGKAFSWVTLCEQRGKVTTEIHPAVEIEPGGRFLGKTITASAKVTKALEPYLLAAKAERERPIGVKLEAPLTRSREADSPFGAAMAACLRATGKADFALMNSGGLRQDLPAGDLNYGQLYEALPFDNRLAVITLPGSAVEEIMATMMRGGHGHPQVAGLTVNRETGVKTCGGEKLDPAKTYTLATNEFLAQGGDGLKPIIAKLPKEQVRVHPDLPVREAFLAWLKTAPQERRMARCP